MRAAVYEEFAKPLKIQRIADPTPRKNGVVIGVKANGICRSDWHGWMGHDPDITLPHVSGHELAGVVESVGKDVVKWNTGDRVTLPFVCGCGTCPQCVSGNQQVCDKQFQPEKLIQKTISLDESLEELINMDSFRSTGVTGINEF